MNTRLYAPCLALLLTGIAHGQGPEVTNWMLNQGETGSYYVVGNSTPVVTTTPANVQLVQYSAANVYISATGIPAYPTAPFLDGNPSLAGSNSYIFRISRNPQVQNGTLTEVPLGHVGVLLNGVPIFNAEDAMSYNGQGIWLRNAVYWENGGMDCSKGHPAPNMGGGGLMSGRYHHHQNPTPFNTSDVLLSSVCTQYPSPGFYTPDPAQHAPMLGYAFDGFPIYGCFGHSDPLDAASPIARIRSSWQLRNITVRQTLADGTVLPANQYGPAVGPQYPIGCYIQDFTFVAGSGDLDEHNGRFCVTPEYPGGTYAYFATVDADLNSAYPYFIGPTYHGVVATDNFGVPGPGNPPTNVTVPGGVTTWTGSSGISGADARPVIIVSPNPTDGPVRMVLPAGVRTYAICDITGREVRRGRAAAGVLQEDLGDLPAGTWLVRSEGTNGICTARVVRR